MPPGKKKQTNVKTAPPRMTRRPRPNTPKSQTGNGPEDVEIDRAYYMPTPADGSVRALRRWIAK